jgi:hypothetical protein
MILTLTLAAGLFAAPLPQTEPPQANGWVIEVRGYLYHKKVELPKRKELIIEFQWQEVTPHIDPVEALYVDDLRRYFK